MKKQQVILVFCIFAISHLANSFRIALSTDMGDKSVGLLESYLTDDWNDIDVFKVPPVAWTPIEEPQPEPDQPKRLRRKSLKKKNANKRRKARKIQKSLPKIYNLKQGKNHRVLRKQLSNSQYDKNVYTIF